MEWQQSPSQQVRAQISKPNFQRRQASIFLKA